MNSGTGLDYNQGRLRSWYIARLRKQAIDESGAFNMTPAALINADRIALERVVKRASNEQRVERPLTARKSPPLYVALGLIAMLWLAIVLSILNLLPKAAAMAFSIISLTTVGASTLGYMYTQLDERLKTMHAAMKSQDPVEHLANGSESSKDLLTAEERLAGLLYTMSKLEEGQRLIADYPSHVVCTFNQSKNILGVSPSSKKAWGYLPIELQMGAWNTLLSEFDKQALIEAFERASAARVETKVETQLKTGFQDERSVRWAIEWSATEKVYFVIATDITVERKLERLKQEFFAVISHDIRTPMANIVSTIALVQHGLFGEISQDGQNRLETVQASSNYVLELLNNLLEVESIENSSFTPHYQPTSLPKLMAEIREPVAALAAVRSIGILIGPVAEKVLMLDKLRTKRVMINLLSNAIKFSNDGSQVELCAEASDDTVTLSVRDHGRGISSADQQRLFTRFEQIEAEDATLRGGTGLGLHSCKIIVNALGGEILLESELGKGSVFTVHLPATAPRQNAVVNEVNG